MRRLALVSVFLAATVLARAQTPSLDPGISGVWIGQTTSTKGATYTEYIVWFLYPTGQFVQHVQNLGPNVPIDLFDNNSDTATTSGTFTASGGTLTLTPTQGAAGTGPYALSDDHSHLIEKFAAAPNGFIFVRYGTTDQNNRWDAKAYSPVFAGSLSCTVPAQGNVAKVAMYGPAHWVDPGLAGVWMRSDAPSASNPNPLVSIWIIHPDGSTVVHGQKVSASQPADPNSSAHDVSTTNGNLDIFGGHFSLTSLNGLSGLTGTYTLNGDQISISFDSSSNAAPLVYKRAGYFDLTGAAHLQ